MALLHWLSAFSSAVLGRVDSLLTEVRQARIVVSDLENSLAQQDELFDPELADVLAKLAEQWTGLLINLNKDSAAENLQQLRDGTVGQLNVEFDNTMAPFTSLVAKLDSKTVGQVESVSIETLHHQPGDAQGRPQEDPQPELASVAARTDTVLVVATSVNQNAGAQPTTVRWNLRLDVSDVDGKLLVSHLETIR